jgi:hypothetical protein
MKKEENIKSTSIKKGNLQNSLALLKIDGNLVAVGSPTPYLPNFPKEDTEHSILVSSEESETKSKRKEKMEQFLRALNDQDVIDHYAGELEEKMSTLMKESNKVLIISDARRLYYNRLAEKYCRNGKCINPEGKYLCCRNCREPRPCSKIPNACLMFFCNHVLEKIPKKARQAMGLEQQYFHNKDVDRAVDELVNDGFVEVTIDGLKLKPLEKKEKTGSIKREVL